VHHPPVASSADVILDPERLVARLADLAGPALRPEAARIVRAPGRVNLIGEHTDYNAGLVLPVAIGLETWIAFVPTDDRTVLLRTDGDGEPAAFELDAIGPRRGSWIDYVAGTAWALAQAAVPTHGLLGIVAADLPREAGLSSSASLELAAAWALSDAAPPRLSDLGLARACQQAENDYVGVQCGLMDQFAVACGQPGAAMLLDCRSLEYRPVPLPEDLGLVVCHSGSRRRLGTSAYNARREMCEQSVAAVVALRPDVRSLRDLRTSDLDWLAGLVDEAHLRCCRHVITENARVEATVAALEAGDHDALARAFAESHASLRDDYMVSSPELDLLVDVATRTPGVVAARMTGAGFGGCTVNLVRPEAIGQLREAVEREYRAATGLEPAVMVVEAVAGASPVDRQRT
jgi:galactokinase